MKNETYSKILNDVVKASALFEKWALTQGYDLTRENEALMATYKNTDTEHAWRGFCHASLPEKESESKCEYTCKDECLAKMHGCASECPALPWQPSGNAVNKEYVAAELERIAYTAPISGNTLAQARVLMAAQMLRDSVSSCNEDTQEMDGLNQPARMDTKGGSDLYAQGWNGALSASQEQTPQTMCECGDRLASQCEEQWGPECDLGNNPAYVKAVYAHDFKGMLERGAKAWADVNPQDLRRGDFPVSQSTLAHEVWAAAQIVLGQGAEEGIKRVEELLQEHSFKEGSSGDSAPSLMSEFEKGNLILEYLGPAALLNKKMSPLEAFSLGVQAAEKYYKIAKKS